MSNFLDKKVKYLHVFTILKRFFSLKEQFQSDLIFLTGELLKQSARRDTGIPAHIIFDPVPVKGCSFS